MNPSRNVSVTTLPCEIAFKFISRDLNKELLFGLDKEGFVTYFLTQPNRWVNAMQFLRFHTEEFPHLEAVGARYVVVAVYGEWRDGDATNDPNRIPQLRRELRKRFMSRLNNAA